MVPHARGDSRPNSNNDRKCVKSAKWVKDICHRLRWQKWQFQQVVQESVDWKNIAVVMCMAWWTWNRDFRSEMWGYRLDGEECLEMVWTCSEDGWKQATYLRCTSKVSGTNVMTSFAMG